MKKVNLLRPLFRVEECLSEVRECLEVGWTGLGFKTVQIEQSWKDKYTFKHALFLNSATSGLHLAIKVLKNKYGWQNGDEIISTGMTFVSTNHAILYENLTPVFAACDESLNMNPASVERMVTPKTKAIIFVGVGGNMKHYSQVREIARKANLQFIFDGAHCAGGMLSGTHAGLDADVSSFSFQAVKNLPTADSGMICFQDSEFDSYARELSWLGINKDTFLRKTQSKNYQWQYDVNHVGFKYHGNSIMAGLALVGLKYLEEDNILRRQIAKVYENELSSVKGILFIKHEEGSSRHLCQLLVERRDELMVFLNERGVECGVHYKDNTRYSVYTSYRRDDQYKDFTDNILSLPLNCHMSTDDAFYVAKKIREFAG